MDLSDETTIPDIMTADGKYNFTDGCGLISEEFIMQVAKASGKLGSAYQIRYGGSKGVVALDTRPDELLTEAERRRYYSRILTVLS